MTSKIVLVTGANSGIGYEIVKAFLEAETRYHVLLGSRSYEKGKAALQLIQTECSDAANTVELVQLDVTSDESIEKAVETVKNGPGRLDTLIHNAGAGFDADFEHRRMSLRDSFNKAYDVNVSGAHVLTWMCIPLLLKSQEPRILFLAAAGWPKKIDFETIGYRCSKTAMNMLMLDWNHKLKEDGIKVFSVSPGFCATNLIGNGSDAMKAMGAVHPSEGGQRILAVAEGKRDADSGKVLDKEGFLPW